MAISFPILAAHLAALPARYCIGRWSHIPASSLLIFNGVDISLNILIRTILGTVIKSKKWKFKDYQCLTISLSCRTVACITAFYAASLLKNPIPAHIAALTTVAAAVSICAGMCLASFFIEET